MQPHRGTLILVLGIVSLVCCGFVGIPAWIMGNSDLKEIDAGRMDPTGRGMVNAGRICGMIATALMVVPLILGLVAAVLYFLLGVRPAFPH